MKVNILTFLFVVVLCFSFNESKAQQDSSDDKKPIIIEKTVKGSVPNIQGRNVFPLEINYEAIELPQPKVVANDVPSVVKTQKSTEADYPHKRILLQGECVILEVNGNAIRIDSSHFEVFSSEIETAIKRTPSWLHDDLRFKFRLLTSTSQRTKLVNLLNSTEKKYLDEVAFTLAHLPNEVLNSSRFANDWNYLLENAKMIYAYADSLKYVRLVEEGDTNSGNWSTTTEYKIKQSSNYIWRKIDKYYYYMFIVMPKLQQEGVFVTDNTSSTDQRTWGYGWRDYLWNNPDATHNYTNVNCTTSVATITTIPKLGEIMQQPDYLWNEQKTYYLFNRPFDANDHAMNILGNWASRCIPMDVTVQGDYRPSQPNQIAWKHVGNCHEDALLVAAAARTSLIPLMHISDNCDDHVWGMFHDADNTDTWHHFEFFRGGCTPLGDSRQQYWGMTNMQRYAGYGWSSSLVQGYVPDGTMINVSDFYSKNKPSSIVKLKITDSKGNPVDGVKVQLYSTNTQYSTKYILSAGYLWTDSKGEVNAPVGTGKEYYLKIEHPKFGSFPEESGKVFVVANANTVSGKEYAWQYAFPTSPARTSITDKHEEFEANKSVKIDFLAKNITTGVNPSDWQRSTFYDKTGTDASVTAYIVEESEIAKFKSGSNSAVAQYGTSFLLSGQYNIPLFKTGKTYIILSNNSNVTNAVELFYTADLAFVDSVDFAIGKNVTVKESSISSNTIFIHPNPVSDKITVSFSEQLSDSWKITLFDIYGKNIKSVTNQQVIPVSELSSGMYFVRIEYGNSVVMKKIIKH